MELCVRVSWQWVAATFFFTVACDVRFATLPTPPTVYFLHYITCLITWASDLVTLILFYYILVVGSAICLSTKGLIERVYGKMLAHYSPLYCNGSGECGCC